MKVTLVMAMTVDGIIARRSDEFPGWTGKEDKKMFKSVTQKAGVVVMGSKTFDTIGRPLPGRLNVVLTRNKKRVSRSENLVFTDAPPDRLIEDLARKGFSEVVVAGGATINTLFAAQRLIDEIYVTYAPKIFGLGMSLFCEPVQMELELIAVECLSRQHILAKYRVVETVL